MRIHDRNLFVGDKQHAGVVVLAAILRWAMKGANVSVLK
jgi:hypothetical protein